ncbi:MAG: primosomal protein N' [Endomicrobium sp.]|jgi:primosomal protein N' (replication factor Y)|nr:primosomal protein N' [Endomicrobium sp.]
MIVLEIAIPIPLNKMLYYLPPKNIDPINIVGRRVKVQVGKRVCNAFAISYKEIANISFLKLKYILKILDDHPIINQEAIDFSNYISKNYMCSFSEALTLMIPISMKLPKKNIKSNINTTAVMTTKKYIVNLQYNYVIDLIIKSIKEKVYNSFLLHNINVSWNFKIEIYINIVMYILKQNKIAMILLSETFLVAKLFDILEQKFGADIVMWYNKSVSDVEKYKMFLKVKTRNKKIIIGTRSAVFAPLENLGLIIIDEEHEQYTYKHKEKINYNIVDIAQWRCNYHNAVVILESVCPSFENYTKAREKKIKLIELRNKYTEKLYSPKIEIVSKKNKIEKLHLLFSKTIEIISEKLKKKEQIVILFNHRGYYRVVMCGNCNTIYKCLSCSISMVLYKNPDLLKCNYCGKIKYLPLICDKCQSKKMQLFGWGIQMLEEELRKKFKMSSIYRFDEDKITILHKFEFEKMFNVKKYDILLATQIMLKRFYFFRVSLICVLNADISLYPPDFRATEKFVQFVTQIARYITNDGTVVLQTSHPDNYAINCAKRNDYLSFYDIEMQYRKKLFYPPYCNIIKITIRDKEKEKVEQNFKVFFLSKKFCEKLYVRSKNFCT